MLNSLLAADIGSTILYVFIILGVVIAVSLIVYFIWELVLSYTSKKNQNETKTTRTVRQDSNLETYTFDEKPKSAPKLLTNKYAEVDEAKAEEEKNAISESEEERLNRERREYLEKRRQELIKRIQEENQLQEQDEQVEEEETQEEEEVEEEMEEPVEEQEEESVEEEQEETDEEATDRLEEEREELLREKEKYEQMVQELEDAKKKLMETVVPTQVQTVVVTPIDELKDRLAAAEEKLRANEKDFKQCKKDFIPLNKVWKTHENDEKKLRRKEALVAKQKVVLYGVNNYADIDEEKAKKLAEDLDLLDGLKLSVQHCEEVMAKNAERYPLLKRMYEVLKRQNTELKDEIKSLKEEIEKREAEENGESEE